MFSGPGSRCWSGATTPATSSTGTSLDTLTRLGVKLISVRPSTQLHWDAAPTGDPREAADVTVIGDSTGRLKSWFDTHPVGFVIIRPDRYVAAAALAQHAPSVTASLATAIHLSPLNSPWRSP